MRKQALSPFLFILSMFISQLGTASSALADESHVGDIRYSILSENDFTKLHGTEWEMLRGQPVPNDSELREYWGTENLPDARGVFLRSANHGRPRNEGNPDGTLPVGSYQPDVMVSHRHTVGPTGGGSTFISRGKGACELHHGLDKGGYFHDNGATGITRDTLHMSHEGGAETRPRNITVNTFVKVRESAPINHETQISAEWVTKLFQSAEFLRALRESVTATIRSFI